MEKAIFICKKENLKYLSANYTRLYFGIEFCQNLLPSLNTVKEIEQVVKARGLDFSFVTPYVTDKGLKNVRHILDEISNTLPQSEIVVNDWGVLRVVKNSYPNLKPVLGRLLIKIKRGPRLVNFMDSLPPLAREYFLNTNLSVSHYREFLKSCGIERIDLDVPLQGLAFDKLPDDFSYSVYLPFTYVTTTRFCLVANCDDPAKKGLIGVFPCGKECQKYSFYLTHKVMPVLLIRRGNTIFYKIEKIPKFKGTPINRLVIQPEIPV